MWYACGFSRRSMQGRLYDWAGEVEEVLYDEE